MAIEHRMDGALGRDGNSGESAQEALANLAGTPGRVLALHVQDEVFHLEGKLMRIAVGPSAAVRQSNRAAMSLHGGLRSDSPVPASHNIPRQASCPPQIGRPRSLAYASSVEN